MPNLPVQIPLPLAALAAALYGAWLLWLLIVRGRVLQNKDEADTDRMLGLDTVPAPEGSASLPQQLAAAGLALEPTTFTAIRAGCTALAFGLTTLLSLPIVIKLVAVIAGWLAPRLWLVQRRRARERSIDDDLPAALSGLAASLSISNSLTDALQAAAEAVSPAGDDQPRLLAILLRRVLAAVRAGTEMPAALRDLQRHSPSLTLALLAFNLRLYDTMGEAKFTRQIIDTAARVRTLLDGRQRARAYAASAKSVVALIIGLTVFMFALAFQDPAFAAYYQSARGTLALLVIGGIMAAGYWSMQHLLDEVG